MDSANKRAAIREALEDDLGDLMPDKTRWTHPTGGLYVWLTLPKSIDTSRDGPLFARAVELGMLYVPGDYCYPADPTRTVPKNQIRLSFGVPTEQQNREGVRVLAQAIRDGAGSLGGNKPAGGVRRSAFGREGQPPLAARHQPVLGKLELDEP